MKQIIHTSKAPEPLGPYSQAVRAGNTVYLSGQIGIDPSTGAVSGETVSEQAKQVMLNLKEVLKAAGVGFEHVVKTSIFLKDMNDFAAVNEIYGAYFDEETAPARETVEVANLPKFVLVEISVIAVVS